MTFYCNHFALALGQRLWKDAKALLLWCTLNSLLFSGQEIIHLLQFEYRSFKDLFKFCLDTLLAFLNAEVTLSDTHNTKESKGPFR